MSPPIHFCSQKISGSVHQRKGLLSLLYQESLVWLSWWETSKFIFMTTKEISIGLYITTFLSQSLLPVWYECKLDFIGSPLPGPCGLCFRSGQTIEVSLTLGITLLNSLKRRPPCASMPSVQLKGVSLQDETWDLTFDHLVWRSLAKTNK